MSKNIDPGTGSMSNITSALSWNSYASYA
jgi:hypothetical protein